MTYLMIEGDQAHTSGALPQVLNVIIHATVSGCHKGGARENARYFQSPNAGGLAHFVVDPGEVVQTCKETVAGWHAPPRNKDSLGVELTDPQAGSDTRWGDPDHVAMLQRAAVLVADLCHRHNVPTVYVDSAALLAGQHGITTHHDVTNAWHSSTHTDPGPAFPMGRFLDMVHAVGKPTVQQNPYLADAGPCQRAPGDQGAVVRFVKWALGLPVDGVYDDTVVQKIRELQHSHGRQPDGVVGGWVLEFLKGVTR